MSQSSMLRSSAVMAAGTLFSRASGFVRSALLVAALGAGGFHPDAFNIANTIPNALYILLAGGVINAVLVPQLVRAARNDPDGGEAYTNRIVTLAGLFLAVVTIVLVIAAPLLMRLYLDGRWYQPEGAAYLESTIDFARWCLPQVFFYGMFVLVGQVLNARGSFGPMMWAPIANNVISIATLVCYLVVFGPAASGGYSTGQEVLLGLGSTLGIAAQFLLLLPVLRRAGFSYSPRFDFRGAGLGHTARLGVWTIGFVVVNQVAYTVVTRLASAGAADHGTGLTVYANSNLVTQVPHSIITVSLATAMLPALSRLAADGQLPELGRTLSSTMRTSLAVIIPVAALIAMVAEPVARTLFGYGAGSDSFGLFAPTLAIFAPGLVAFTVHYLLLRGYYSLELNRTAFVNQCFVAATNVVAAIVLVHAVDPRHTAAALAGAWGLSYAVGATIGYVGLHRILGDLDDGRLLGFVVRIVQVAAAVAVVAWALQGAFEILVGDDAGRLEVLLHLAIVGVISIVVVLVGSRVLRITEVNAVVAQLTRKLGRR